MKINILIPMAGMGKRFKDIGVNVPKPLIKVNGKTLIEHSVNSLGIEGQYIFITRKYEDSKINEELTTLLKNILPDSIEIQLDAVTSGAAETALYAKNLINNDTPLIITNCDQITNWDSSKFINAISNKDINGAVVLFKSKDSKNSFASIENDYVVEIVEKKQISDNALIGLHYWEKGKDFVESAEDLIKNFRISGSPECYISETYNYLIKNNKKILPFFINKNNYISLGTPEDVSVYLGKIKEYYTEKPKTIFCDIDGTIVKHQHKFSNFIENDVEILDGVRDKFNEWDSKGHKIILTTARKESSREMTEKDLRSIGLCWDQLIMGVTSGERILINDKLTTEDPDRAFSINIITDAGFDTIDWGKVGL